MYPLKQEDKQKVERISRANLKNNILKAEISTIVRMTIYLSVFQWPISHLNSFTTNQGIRQSMHYWMRANEEEFAQIVCFARRKAAHFTRCHFRMWFPLLFACWGRFGHQCKYLITSNAERISDWVGFIVSCPCIHSFMQSIKVTRRHTP